ncbi:DUF4834 family protein [Carboxylicivirga caseinilyticus]|uniref:DUF4834 family protein n=1 Tax=Carboxylicivirga caseinilyticus TaxID=3417572 RepID=UPI003D33594E|nr:DUF4834 family protein [Marinilabiliaceae bacterium A049]
MIVGLIRTIFYIVVFYYLFKFIGQLVMPFFLKKGFERMQKQQDNAANNFRQEAKRKEGTVTIQKNTNSKTDSHIEDNQGEYVDFEDVK